MKTRPADPNIHTQTHSPWVKLSTGDEREEPIDCQVTYTYEADGFTYAGEGTTRDFSKIGCGIRGSIIPPVGSKTRLTLYLLDPKASLSFDATITWVAGDYFGVQFPEVNERDYTRIRRYMWNVLNR
jgi:hypothetical protein